MATISELLSQLQSDKNSLVTNLVTKGVSAENTETFTSLVPKVLNITSGGIDTSDATAEVNTILSGYSAYVKGQKITGNIPSKGATIYTPSVNNQEITSGQYLSGNQTILGDVNLTSSNIKNGVTIFGIEGTMQEGIDTSDANAAATDLLLNKTAYVNGEKITGTIASLGETEYVPTTTNQIINSGQYISEDQTILGDANLVSENIKSGITIFNITGSYTGGSSSTNEVMLLDTTTSTSQSDTLANYGDKIYISEDNGTTFSLLSKIIENDGGLLNNNNQYISSNSANKYGIYMGNWLDSATTNSILFAEPIFLSQPYILLILNCNVNSWSTQTLNIHLVEVTGETNEEKLESVKNNIANNNFAISKTYSYNGSSTQTDIFTQLEASSTLSGEYYLYISGTQKGTNEFTYIKMGVINF